MAARVVTPALHGRAALHSRAGRAPGGPMIGGKRICVVMPAYNAARTLEATSAEVDRTLVDDVILVDDASRDGTVPLARDLGLHHIVHPSNRGYGGNQKTCYREALAR